MLYGMLKRHGIIFFRNQINLSYQLKTSKEFCEVEERECENDVRVVKYHLPFPKL